MLINLYIFLATAKTVAKSQQICKHCRQFKETKEIVEGRIANICKGLKNIISIIYNLKKNLKGE